MQFFKATLITGRKTIFVTKVGHFVPKAMASWFPEFFFFHYLTNGLDKIG